MTAPDADAFTGDEKSAPRWPMVATAVVLVALGLVPTGNLLTGGEADPSWGRHVREWGAWLVISPLFVLAMARLGGESLRVLIARVDAAVLALPPRVFAVVAGTFVTALSLAIGYAAFQMRPVSGDELSQLWQAHLLSSGHLAARTPSHPEFFTTIMTVVAGDRWFSQFPIGGPATIALGLMLGVPWLINPLLTGWTAVALHAFVSAIEDERTARRATVLFALSPFVLLMGGSEMNHVLVLACVTTALAAMPRWVGAPTNRVASRPAIVIGLALGVAATSRPYDAALVGVPIALFQLVALRGGAPKWRSIVWECAAGAVPIILLLAANYATTGAPLLFGYDLLNGAAHRPGFHVSPLLQDHTPVRGLRVLSSYLMALDSALLAWPVPAVLLLVAALLLQRRATRWDLLLAGVLASLLAGYGAYWAESYFAGPRFLYCAVPFFMLLIARLPRLMAQRLRGTTVRTAAALLIPFWLTLAWVLPPNSARAYGVGTMVRLSVGKRTTGADIAQRAREERLTNAIVFVPDGWHQRLVARLQRAGVRPLQAGQIVARADACAIQMALDSLESPVDSPTERKRHAFVAMVYDTTPVPLAGLRPGDQVALVPGRPLTPRCRAELDRADSHGVSIAELLPFMSVDASGALAGDVVYARDFGATNERLRAQFGRRQWLVAHVTPAPHGITVLFVPYALLADSVGLPWYNSALLSK